MAKKDTTLTPLRVEAHTPASAKAMIKRLGARYMPEYSADGMWTYWTPTKYWLLFERKPDGSHTLSWYASCPCQT